MTKAATSSIRGAGFQPARVPYASESRGLRRPHHEDLGETAYFVTTRCHRSQFLLTGAAADVAVEELFALRERYGFRVLSFVFMSNHAHFVIVPAGGYTISQTMRLIKGAIAHRVNALSQRQGPVWQDGFRDNVPATLDELNSYIRYIEDNPVKAGLCASPSAFRYSSANGRCVADYEWFLGIGKAQVESPHHEMDAIPSSASARAESPRHGEGESR
jgi:REP element-mobilizing transposase RayT